MKEDYYEILGISKGASNSEIKKAPSAKPLYRTTLQVKQRKKTMNKNEVINALLSLRFKLEKSWDGGMKVDDLDIEAVAEATRMLTFSSLNWK